MNSCQISSGWTACVAVNVATTSRDGPRNAVRSDPPPAGAGRPGPLAPPTRRSAGPLAYLNSGGGLDHQDVALPEEVHALVEFRARGKLPAHAAVDENPVAAVRLQLVHLAVVVLIGSAYPRVPDLRHPSSLSIPCDEFVRRRKRTSACAVRRTIAA